jgi:hypothetical protein
MGIKKLMEHIETGIRYHSPIEERWIRICLSAVVAE